MRTSDELFERVVARMEAHEQKQQQRIRTFKRVFPVLACFCFAVTGGLFICNHTEKIPTAPARSPFPEITDISESTAVSSANGTQITTHTSAVSTTDDDANKMRSTRCTTNASTTVVSDTITEMHAEGTSIASTAVASDIQTHLLTETTYASSLKPAPDTFVPSTISVRPTEPTVTSVQTDYTETSVSAAGSEATETVTQSVVTPVTEAETTTHTKSVEPIGVPVIGEPDIQTDTDPKEPVHPELSGFKITRVWGGWYVECLEPVSPSPENSILYTVNSEQFAIEDAVSLSGGNELVGMYAIGHRESRKEIAVLQYRRDTFSFSCTPLIDPESGMIGSLPCLWGKEYNETVLYWDDGYFTFRISISSNDREVLRELAECLVQTEEPSELASEK